jgi:hypothetical protein
MNSFTSSAFITALLITLGGCTIQRTTPCDCTQHQEFPADLSMDAELDYLKDEAETVFGLDLSNAKIQGSENNFVGIATPTVRISRRIDSRTYLIQDEEFGVNRPKGFFNGSDSAVKKIGQRVLAGIGIDQTEIAEEAVMTEMVQVAKKTDSKLTHEPPQAVGKSLRVSRKVAGLPVFSSKLSLSLTEKQDIGDMELHWPELPRWTLVEAKRLEALVYSGWQPPKHKGAKPESIQAGITHSPAIGFTMDIYPAIQVIYASEDERIGRKLVQYYDRHGRVVATPRVFVSPEDAQHKQWGKKRTAEPMRQ